MKTKASILIGIGLLFGNTTFATADAPPAGTGTFSQCQNYWQKYQSALHDYNDQLQTCYGLSIPECGNLLNQLWHEKENDLKLYRYYNCVWWDNHPQLSQAYNGVDPYTLGMIGRIATPIIGVFSPYYPFGLN